jgi:hypothetical protein
MADERAGADKPTGSPANDDKITTGGREQNAATPFNAADDNAGAERYPSVRQDDAVERTGRTEAVTGEARTFTGEGAENPQPPQGAGDTSPVAKQDGLQGPGGDPVEGAR